MFTDLEEINGNEIIDFFNSIEEEYKKSFYSLDIIWPFKFISQEIKNNQYILNFSFYYKNWDDKQLKDCNYLYISKDQIYFDLDEPLDTDNTDKKFLEKLNPWLKKHKFKDNNELIYNLVINIQDQFDYINPFATKEDLQKIDKIIEDLEKLKSYIK